MNRQQTNKIISEIIYNDGADLLTRIDTHKNYSLKKIEWVKWVSENIPDNDYKNIADLGCGTGLFIKELANKYPGAKISGIDLSPSNIETAREYINKDNVELIVGDVSEYDYINEKYDLVLCNHMLWHIKDQRIFLEKVKNHLSGNGILIATANSYEYMKEMYDVHQDFAKELGLPAEIFGKRIRGDLFSTKNGNRVLKDHFNNVEEILLDDKLIFRTSEPYIRYYLTFLKSEMKIHKEAENIKWERLLDKMKEHTNKEIKEKGEFIVNKNSVMYIASNNR